MLRYVLLGITLMLGLSSTDALAIELRKSSKGKVNIIEKAELTERQKVDRLIQFIRNLKGATFIRNGSEHTCQEAADHLQSKWEKHRDSILSAEDFIEELASRSGFSGKAYKIRYPDGTETTTNAVLKAELKRLEQL